MKKLSVFIFAILCSLSSIAQQKTQLSGKITDNKTRLPLAGATVVLVDMRLTTVADSNGIYTFKNVPIGHTAIEISYVGYSTVVEHIDINGTTVKDFSLNSSVVENDAVTVTAVASATSIKKAPIAITRVNRGELLATPSTNIIDALSRQPGISQITTGPAISKPVIRGLGYNRLVVINDGIRQEGQQWGDEHGIEIDENSVNRVEIVKGPASLIYGSDAIAGVINIITTVPPAANVIKGSVLSSYQTNNKQRSLYANVGGNKNGFNWNVWGDYKAASDYKNKYDGNVFNSRFHEGNFGGYAGVNSSWGFTHFIISSFNQKTGIIEGDRDASGHFIKHLAGGVDVTPTKEDYNSIDPYFPYQHIQHFKGISENSFKSGKGRITLNLGWQQNTRTEFGNVDIPTEKSLQFVLRTFNYSTAYHFDDKKGWTLSVGLNGMQQSNKNKGVEVLIPEYSLFDIGTYIYTQKTINKLSLSGGIRFDNRSLDSKAFSENGSTKFSSFTKNFSNVSGSAGLSYAASKEVTLKANVARGFRAPSIPELASNGAHEGTNRYEYGDQALKSEISYQGDLSLEFNSDHVLLNASLFYNSISNFIFYSKLSTKSGTDSLVLVNGNYIPAYKFNQHNAALYGGEFKVDLHPHPLDWLHLESTFSYVKGQFKESVEGTRNVPSVPAARWLNELRGEVSSKGKALRNIVVFFEADHTFSQNNAFTAYDTETPTGAYTLFNAGISGNIARKNKTIFSVYLLAGNLTDVAYQTHLSRLKYTDVNAVTGRQGVFNMGRNFSIKVNVPLTFR
jgi:iron complex outermembrane recepter protein